MENFGKIVAYILFTVFMLFLTAFTVSTLWGWFVVPLGVKAITLTHAIGLSLFVNYFQMRSRYVFKSEVLENRTYSQRAGLAVMICTVSLFIGWIVASFM